METASQELLLRGNNKRELGEQIAEIPILTRPNGDVITIDDVGNVIDGFAETNSSILVNGRPGLVVQVSKTNDEDLFTIVEAVRNYVAQKKVPAGYKLDTWGDISVDVRERMELLTRNGLPASNGPPSFCKKSVVIPLTSTRISERLRSRLRSLRNE